MSGLTDFESTPKRKSGSVEEYYYLRAVLAAPSIAIVNAIDEGYGW